MVVGFYIDVGKALCERARLQCEFVTQAWDGIIPALNVGKYDAVMAGISITDKRRQFIAFSQPYALMSNFFVVARDAGLPAMGRDLKVDPSSSDDVKVAMIGSFRANLKGRIIGVQGSTNAEAFVREYLGNTVEVRTYDKQDNLNLDLVAGRIDAGLGDYSVWKEFLKSAAGAGAQLYGPRISGGIFGPGVGVGLRKSDIALAATFDAVIEKVAADGTLKTISLKWFGADLVSN